jgi:two-component system OmpR family response regulator
VDLVRGRDREVRSKPEVIGTRLLVVEDAPKLLAILTSRMRGERYAVDGAGTGRQAIEFASTTAYDAIVLDLRLGDIDGIDVCRQLRAAECWSPILMLTARDAVADRVGGLDAGADDYLTKPFAFPELFARVRALVRRGAAPRPPVLVAGDLVLDPAAHVVRRGERLIELTPREFALLEFFMRHPNVVLGRRRLVEHVWDHAYQGESNIIDVHMRSLRAKLDPGCGFHALQTVRGVVYRLAVELAAAATA